MQVYRIATSEYIHDLSGYGAKLNGGRWNREGIAVLYTGSSIALCAWEYFVHLPETVTLKQNTFSVATIELPDSSVKLLPTLELPPDWENQTSVLRDITDAWLREEAFLALQVPSAVISGEFNYLLNPSHPLFKFVTLQLVEPFSFDRRAFDKKLLG